MWPEINGLDFVLHGGVCGDFRTTSEWVSLCFELFPGTTEKIFESKSDLYDVYVNNQNIKCKPYLSAIQYINTFDKDRYNRLLDYR